MNSERETDSQPGGPQAETAGSSAWAVAPPSEFAPDLVQASMEARLAARMLGQTLEGVFARYRIGEALGRGGMGAVYAATDEQLGREVAIKMLKRRGEERALRRFRSEARAMAAIEHPNVIKVFELGEYERRPFIVMERIEGPTLRGWLREHSRSSRDVLELMLGVARALAAVHGRGLEHRDIKPSNILVEPSRGAVLIDFGLSRLEMLSTPHHSEPQAGATASGSRLTQTGVVVGTPAYMAPESYRRDSESGAGARTDQWAFCLVLWEALFAARPEGLAALKDVPTPALDWSPAQGRLPAAARAALLRGLHAEPAKRWPDMAALIKALRPPRRRSVAVAAVGAVTAAAAAAVLVTSTPAADERVPTAGVQLAGVYAASVLATGRAHAASNAPNQSIGPLETAFFAATAAGEDVAAAESAGSLADVYIVDLQNVERARYWLQVLEVLVERNGLGGVWPHRVASTQAKIFLMEMKPAEARSLARTALDGLGKEPQTDDVRRLRQSLLTAAANASNHLQEPEEALKNFEAALELAEADPDYPAQPRLRLKFNVVRSRFYLDPSVATSDALVALAREVEEETGDGALLRIVRTGVVASMLDVDRYDQALRAANELLESLPEEEENVRPIRARTLLLIGTALSRLERHDEAVKKLYEALVEHHEAFGAEHMMSSTVDHELARALVGVQRYADAITHYETAIRIVAASFGEDAEFSLILADELARLYETKGDLEQAAEAYASLSKRGAPDGWTHFAGKLGLLSVSLRQGGRRKALARELATLRAAATEAGHIDRLGHLFEDMTTRLAGDSK